MADIFFIICALAAWPTGLFILWKIPCPRKNTGTHIDFADTSVIVPARDEKRRLPLLLASLKQQAVQPGEIIVADDESADDTAAVYFLYAGQVWWMLRRLGKFGLMTALLFPMHLMFFHLIFFQSYLLTLFEREITWKGRDTRRFSRFGDGSSTFLTARQCFEADFPKRTYCQINVQIIMRNFD